MPHNSWASSASEAWLNPRISSLHVHFRGASSNVNEATGDRAGNQLHNNGTSANAHARVAAGLDLNVNGDCVSAQRLSTGVLNFEGETLMQTFQTCDRGRITEIKMATPFVEPGFTYEYALAYTNGDVITSGTFTSDDATDGELLLELDKGAVRKGQNVMLKVVVPTDARLAVLAYGTNDFGRLYINGQASPYNLAMAAGLDAATASNIQNSDDDGRDKIELGAYPVPFGESLSITVRGTVADAPSCSCWITWGMPVQAISLKGSARSSDPLQRPVQPAPRLVHGSPAQRTHRRLQAHFEGLISLPSTEEFGPSLSRGRPFFLWWNQAVRWAGRSKSNTVLTGANVRPSPPPRTPYSIGPCRRSTNPDVPAREAAGRP